VNLGGWAVLGKKRPEAKRKEKGVRAENRGKKEGKKGGGPKNRGKKENKEKNRTVVGKFEKG
jgi:hypothetical protein